MKLQCQFFLKEIACIYCVYCKNAYSEGTEGEEHEKAMRFAFFIEDRIELRRLIDA